jgi:hypothetical protein
MKNYLTLVTKEKGKETPKYLVSCVNCVAQHGNDDTLLRFAATLRICYIVVVTVYILEQ